VISKQIDDNKNNDIKDDNNDINDATRLEKVLEELPAGSSPMEGVEGSVPLEGVLDRQQEGFALLEGDEFDEFSALLEGDELNKGPALEGPIEESGAFIPIASGMLRRKAAKRTLPWDLEAAELDLVSPLQQAEDILASKRRRLEESLSTASETTATAEVATDAASTDVAMDPPPPDDDVDDEDANTDAATDTQSKPRAADVTGRCINHDDDDDANDDANRDSVMDTQSNKGTTGATTSWTPEEDAELTSAVANTCKMKRGRSTWKIGLQLPRWFRVER
jgi:hypothetical protein